VVDRVGHAMSLLQGETMDFLPVVFLIWIRELTSSCTNAARCWTMMATWVFPKPNGITVRAVTRAGSGLQGGEGAFVAGAGREFDTGRNLESSPAGSSGALMPRHRSSLSAASFLLKSERRAR